MARNSPYYCVDIKWRYPSVGYVLLDSPAKYGYGYPPAESFTDLVLRPSSPFSIKKRLWLSANSNGWRTGFTDHASTIEADVASVEPHAWQFDITHQLLQMIHDNPDKG